MFDVAVNQWITNDYQNLLSKCVAHREKITEQASYENDLDSNTK